MKKIALILLLTGCAGHTSTGLILDNQTQQIINAQHEVANTITLESCKKTCNTRLAEIKATNESAKSVLKESMKEEYNKGWNHGFIWGILIIFGFVFGIRYLISKITIKKP